MTLRPLKNWFENMSPRERFMLLAIAWATVILWGSIMLKQAQKLRAGYQLAVVQLATQQKSIDQRKTVEDQINTYNKIFQTSISGPELVNKIHVYAGEAGLPQQLSISTNKRTTGQKDSIFDINSATITFTHVDQRDLMVFLSKIESEKPYLMIGEIFINPETLDPRLLDGNLRVDSLELKPHALDVNAAENTPPAH